MSIHANERVGEAHQRKGLHSLILFIAILTAAIPAYSQLSSGSILGTVSDSSGAVIPGVSIKVTSPTTGFVREAVTNESGNYRVDQLPVATYTVEAELSGFKKEVRSGLHVDIDQRARIDFTLSPGQVSEVIEVTSAVPLVQTEDSSVGQVVEERKIVTLPLNGRDFSQLAYIVPGAFAPRPGSSLGNRGGFAVAGLSENTNQFLLDGVNNNGTGTMEIAARINIDAVGEFKVQTSTYSAQYGRYAGAQVDVVTKSGTNEFHGTAFGFLRNDNLDARNFFDPFPIKNLPEFRRQQYGGTLGGPIIKDKLFFFAGYQGQRQVNSVTRAPSVPLPEFFDGDLSKLPQIARDPLTGQPFAGNVIPRDRINPISVKFRQFWPLPTRLGIRQNASALLPEPNNFNQPTGKIDWTISSSHSLHGSYNYFTNALREFPIAGNPEVPGFATASKIVAQGISVSENWTVSTTMVNEFRAGFGRVRRGRFQENLKTNFNQELGILGTTADTERLAWGVPFVTITGFSRIGDNTNMPQPRVDQTYTIADNFSMLRGNHALKFGGDYFLQQMNLTLFTNARGRFAFTGAVTGNAFADFLLGLPSETQRQPPLGPLSAHPRRHNISFFFQDDWKLTPTLTVNMGLRWEGMGHMREKFGKLSRFDPTLNGGRGGLLLVGDSQRFDNAVSTFRTLFPGLTIQRGASQLTRNDWNNIAPRFGFAYSPFRKTVVRSAYGIFHQIDDLCLCDFYQNAPFNLAQRFTNTDGVTLGNPWASTAGGGSIQAAGIDPNLDTPYYQQWSFGVQHELPSGVVADVSYQGKKGTNLARGRDLNQPLDRSTGVRPFANFSRVDFTENSASSIYHGFHLRAEKRTNRGGSFLLSYVAGKLIDDASFSPQDSYNLRAERALSEDDVRNRLSFSYVFPLPFGSGQPFLQNLSGIGKQILANWEVSGIARYNSGSPFTPTLSINNSGTGDFRDRPDKIASARKQDRTPQEFFERGAFLIPARGQFGNAGRNTFTGPSNTTWDFSVLKRLDINERQQLQFRAEVFNILNHTNLDTPVTVVNSSNFGAVSSAQASRQIQFGLKYSF